MKHALFKTRVLAGRTVIGTWLTIPHPIVVEAMASAFFDFFQTDGEHGPAHPDVLHELLPAADAAGIPLVYRARRNRDDLVSAALDAGVAAVMVPMVNTREAAESVVKAAKYPPLGNRGFGPWRASNYYRDMENYMDEANAGTLVAVQIEHAEAVKNVDTIASVPGVDLLFVGPADLALSMGIRVGSKDGRIDSAFAAVAEACKRHGKAAGTDIVSLEASKRMQNLGYSFFTYGGDLTYLTAGADEAGANLRETLKV